MIAFHLREHEGFAYLYDFNAWWRHEIRVERRMLRQHPGLLPRCVADWRPCPPEVGLPGIGLAASARSAQGPGRLQCRKPPASSQSFRSLSPTHHLRHGRRKGPGRRSPRRGVTKLPGRSHGPGLSLLHRYCHHERSER
ncbi:plasmid pRiA4b ORF-3 family protein [Cupriavidus consociatus]|uniref:plasmid pRiA4b ORF-3 family protein n=1 Tax=Cupriavidus consociatus TaxID=2821357 RepID=UPI001FD85365|nr:MULTISPECIES: plasmid pRiA4b ORF-3 family protein [unclassified Cupriavidus]MDK2657532.1 plasmid pRiA4b ORF-3 family protein [Cupriavidus sp. LEh21]